MGYYDDYLEHKLGGWSKKNHKYVSRERGKNGKWKYIYAVKGSSTSRGSKSSSGNSVLNVLKRFGENTVDKIGDFFDSDYDKVLDIFDKDVKSNLILNIKDDTGFHYDKYNRQFERKIQRGEVDPSDWEYIDSHRKVKKGDKENTNPVQPMQKVGGHGTINLNAKTHKYYAKIPTGNGKYRYFYTSEEYDRYLKRKQVLDKDYAFMQDVPVLSHKDTPAAASKVVDDPTDVGNCSSCSVALELRMRGYDVYARPDVNGKTDDEIMAMFEGLEGSGGTSNNWFVDTSRAENKHYYNQGFLNMKKTSEEEQLQIAQADLERTILERGGENQRGFITLGWTQTDPDANGQRHVNGGGHIFNYVVENGQVHYYDAQSDGDPDRVVGEIDIKEYLDNTNVTAHEKGYDGGWRTYNAIYRVDDKNLTQAGKDNITYKSEEVHYTPEEIKRGLSK